MLFRKIILLGMLFFISGTMRAENITTPTQSPAQSVPDNFYYPYLNNSNTLSYKSPPSSVGDLYRLTTERGLLKLDYQVIPIPGYQTLDLMGLHYLYGIKNWLYVGVGSNLPVFYGNYGGFFTIDAEAQIQHQLIGNIFGDAGVSFGGGGGGSTARNGGLMCGNGGFTDQYAGLGYRVGDYLFGVNYSHLRFFNSPINHSQVDFYFQKSLSFAVGYYHYLDKLLYSPVQVECDKNCPYASKNVITFELNNYFRYKPTAGQESKPINLISLELSHYLTQKYFIFLEASAGYYGIPAYNELLGGVGYYFLLFPRVGFSSQLGAGSGGYDPHRINTGAGLLIYPKLSLDYLLTQKISLGLTGGYLFAPEGTFQNFTAGLALNYALFTGGKIPDDFNAAEGWIFRGFRVNLFNQTEFDVKVNNATVTNLNLVSVEPDLFVHRHWFIPTQMSFAYSGHLGYAEGLVGFGVQNQFLKGQRFQYFLATMVGADLNGPIWKPEVGVNYSLTDHAALFAMLARTMSINGASTYEINSNSVGVGLTYRFSLLDTK